MAASVSSGIAKRLLGQVEAPYIRKGPTLYYEAFHLVLRDILVERTGYRNTHYIRNLYCLFFAGHRVLDLGYSNRVLNVTGPLGSTFFTGETADIVHAAALSLRPLITPGCWEDGPSLKTIRQADSNVDVRACHAYRKLNMAATSLFDGDVAQARTGFDACAEWLDAFEPTPDISAAELAFVERLRRFVSEFRVSPSHAKTSLAEAARTTAAALGFVARL